MEGNTSISSSGEKQRSVRPALTTEGLTRVDSGVSPTLVIRDMCRQRQATGNAKYPNVCPHTRLSFRSDQRGLCHFAWLKCFVRREPPKSHAAYISNQCSEQPDPVLLRKGQKMSKARA